MIVFNWQCPRCGSGNQRRVATSTPEECRCLDTTCVWCHVKVQIVYQPLECLACRICDERTYATIKIPFDACSARYYSITRY